MSSSLTFRHLRHLSSATATTTISAASYSSTTNTTVSDATSATTTVSGATSATTASSFSYLEATVRSLRKARRFSDIKTRLEALKTDPQIKNEEFLASIIKSYGIVGMFDQALKTYNEMPKLGTPRSSISFNSVLTAFVRGGKFEKVVKMFEEMPKRDGFEPDKVSYGVLIKAYCGMGEVGLAMGKLREMEEKGVEITAITYTTLLHGFYQKGEVEEADRVWMEMVAKGCVDVGSYNVRIMNAHGGDVEVVKELIKEMRDKGLAPDDITLTYLMTSYCKNHLMDEAIEVFGDMESNGIRPNAATFRILLFHLCKNERFETAYDVFKKSVVADRIPDFNTSKYFVEELVKNSKVEEAKEVIVCIKKKFSAKGADWEKVEKQLGLVIAPMVLAPTVVKGCDDVGGYNVKIMNAHEGDVEVVKELIKEMRDKGVTPDVTTYTYLMTSYCKNHLMDEAIKVFGDLESNGCQPNPAIFQTLVFHLCQNGRFETAYEIFNQSVAANSIPYFNTSRLLVEGLVKNSKVVEAKEIIACIREKFPANKVTAWKKVEKQLGLVTAHNVDGDENDTVGASEGAIASA